jgi:thiol-disulfide isomerase/thioredoxin
VRIATAALILGCSTPTPAPPSVPDPTVGGGPAVASAPTAAAPTATAPTVPPLTVERIDAAGLKARISSPSGRQRVVNFWATWCGPCRAEMPALAAFAAERPDVDLLFVNLDHPKAAPERVERFIREVGIEAFPHFRPAPDEPELTSGLDHWPDVLPVTLVVAPDGAIARRVVGAVDEATLRELVGSSAGH